MSKIKDIIQQKQSEHTHAFTSEKISTCRSKNMTNTQSKAEPSAYKNTSILYQVIEERTYTPSTIDLKQMSISSRMRIHFSRVEV